MTLAERTRVEQAAARLHPLGPRVMAEVLIDLADRTSGYTALSDLLGAYMRLTPEAVCAAGGYGFPVRCRPVPSELMRRAG